MIFSIFPEVILVNIQFVSLCHLKVSKHFLDTLCVEAFFKKNILFLVALGTSGKVSVFTTVVIVEEREW